MKSYPRFRVCSIGLTVLLFALNFSVRAADDPFAWPPITAQQKPWAFNWWMGSAVDKTNLTKELERYAAAGLGGIHIIPIYGAKGFEDKYIDYLSPKWMEMMGWAVSEARRLGMDVDMTTGSGWCFGGPQVTDEDANASVVVRVIEVGKDKPWKMPTDLKGVQAFVIFSSDGKSRDVTSLVNNPVKDFELKPAPGDKIYIISQKPSGQKVKRPGPGGEGWMLNLIYPHAMDDFLKPYTAAFANYNGPKPRAQYHDSYEYRSDWSPDFFAQFEKRRGYKLQSELPALFSTKDEDHANRVKCDYRQTVSEIMAEESLPKWTQWSHDHGFITRNQAHGSPGNWLDLYAAADIPETEMFHLDRNKLISKFASSAAHVTGKPLVSSETGTWLEEHFTEKLSDVKYLFDDLFLSGINHMFYHGCCYSPDEAGWPGWHFYASLEMNPRNSIWHDADALNAYAARCQAILQSGQPDNDILLYYNAADFWMQPGDKLLPQLTVHARDWFEGQPIGKVARELWDKGYAFDYVSDAQLKTATAKFGEVKMPGGKYRAIVVPECKFIPLETMKVLHALAENGAMIVFAGQMPSDISGLSNLEKQRQVFEKLKQEIVFQPIKGKKITVASIVKGRMLSGDLDATLEHSGVLRAAMADVGKLHSEITDIGLRYTRRSFDGGEHYFIHNQSGANFSGWVTLGRLVRSVILLDPMTANVGVAPIRFVDYEQRIERFALIPGTQATEVYLQLVSGESIILRTESLYSQDGSFKSGKRIENPKWTNWQTNGQPVEITGDWKVKFISGGPTLPADLQTAKLASWTTFSDTNCQAFGGTAKYETTFATPDSAGKTFELNLGDVRQSARVRVNGKDYGTLITPPFRVVVDNLKLTGNVLEVEVTSVDANRIRDLDRRGVPWKTFRDINIVDLGYKPFDASRWPLTDCGLLGPVTLTAVTAK